MKRKSPPSLAYTNTRSSDSHFTPYESHALNGVPFSCWNEEESRNGKSTIEENETKHRQAIGRHTRAYSTVGRAHECVCVSRPPHADRQTRICGDYVIRVRQTL